MIYIENVYICLAAPLLLAILLLEKGWRKVLAFLLSGMTCCMLSSYVTGFFTMLTGIGRDLAAFEIAPAVEEFVKLIPILFYLLVFEPKRKDMLSSILLVALGFATFENVCFLTANGSSDLLGLLIRGFGTGAMHVVCGVMLSVGVMILWNQPWLRVTGVFAVLCSAITFHAIFNVIVSREGVSLWVGSAAPVVMIWIYLTFLKGKVEKIGSFG
ncbi:MAG: PrsW family intramembrane metalloprotease [Lachnospiraceae bacterium]|nr:PrsW family intramembrane metalloprotease [Lachnospiraceae bacterium]